MRRESDHGYAERTGQGRRARDRILAGGSAPSPALRDRRELDNLVLFLGDDLRESAVAVGAIEGWILEAERILGRPEVDVAAIRRLLEDERVPERLELLGDALTSLRRSLALIVASGQSG